MQVESFIEERYLPSISDLRMSTRVGYESSIALYILPAFGEMELEDIKVWDIEQWLKGIPSAGAAEKAYKTLRQIIRRAIDWDVFEAVDPTRKRIRLPKKEAYTPDVLTGRQLQRVLRGFYGHPLEAVVLCAAALGLRRGEACGLEWRDVDFRSGAVRVERSVQCVQGEVITVAPKTSRSCRTVYLPHFALERLRGIRSHGRLIRDMDPDAVSRRYKAYCKAAGLPYVSLTNLRHTWASLAVQGGADSATVSAMLGHSQINTTYEHYLVPRAKVYKDAQKRFERLVVVP